ncbi:hypothetical protein [Bacillus ndiopicus]|uniref:hypothetical protein n=1 Tax=Bacillus ndiopicus TaxID=1347368 RepID=UPI000AEBC41D|nr:hypothetical protein [Bacillus ndiopicus]
MFNFNHHHPLAPEFLTTVLGFTVVLLISVWFFIHFLRVGLQSSDSTRIDAKK